MAGKARRMTMYGSAGRKREAVGRNAAAREAARTTTDRNFARMTA